VFSSNLTCYVRIGAKNRARGLRTVQWFCRYRHKLRERASQTCYVKCRFTGIAISSLPSFFPSFFLYFLPYVLFRFILGVLLLLPSHIPRDSVQSGRHKATFTSNSTASHTKWLQLAATAVKGAPKGGGLPGCSPSSPNFKISDFVCRLIMISMF